MKLLVWNIRQGGGSRKPAILARIQAHASSILALIEFRRQTSEAFLQSLHDSGWTHQLATQPQGRNHHLCVLAKEPIQSEPSGLAILEDFGVYLQCRLPHRGLTFGVVHVPTSSPRAKRAYFDGLLEIARQHKDSPFLFAGDFNTGLHGIDGNLQALGCVDRFAAIQQIGFPDAFRHFHPSRSEYTYLHRNEPFRIDHALISHSALPALTACAYSHAEREAAISDHSALLLEFAD